MQAFVRVLPKLGAHNASGSLVKTSDAGSRPLLPVVRILARAAARDWISQLSTIPAAREGREYENHRDVSRRT